MSWTQRGVYAAFAGLAGLVLLGRLGGSDEPKVGASSPIKDAVYATAIPVYPGAKLTDRMGGNYYNDIGGPVTFNSESWFFEVKDPMAKVVEFYKKNLPEGAKQVEAEAGSVAFEWVPPAAAEGEEVHIWVSEGKLQIGETIKAKGSS